MRPFMLRSIINEKLGSHRYSSVCKDDIHSPGSATSCRLGSEETILGSPEDQDEAHPRSGAASCLASWKLPVLLVACSILSTILTGLVMRSASFPCTCHESYNTPLMKTPVPKLPKEIRIFEFNQTFVDPPTPENNEVWNNLLPFGRGYIFVPNGSAYGLEPGVQTDHGEIYSLAVYHQLHCLGLVRRNYWRLLEGALGGNFSAVADEARHQQKNSHTGHCFDYFRQSFECAADMTLEWPRTEADGRRFQVDGTGIPHVCTSKRALDEYMELHHFNASKNHDIAA